MNKIVLLVKSLNYILVFGMIACSFNQDVIVIDDISGALGKTKAPVSIELELNKYQVIAAKEGRLALLDASNNNGNPGLIPVQFESNEERDYSHVVMMIPYGVSGLRKFKLIERITKFFRTGIIPVSIDETLEIFAFMQAAEESKIRGDISIDMELVIQKAKTEAFE